MNSYFVLSLSWNDRLAPSVPCFLLGGVFTTMLSALTDSTVPRTA